MIRILILASIGAVISATPFFPDYPLGLESLFARKREAVGTSNEKESTVCETEECKLIANTIMEGIDDSVDPCDDFYQYACGKWDQKNPLPENKTSWSMWEMVENKIQEQIKDIMQSPIEPDDLFAVKLAKKWYQSCKNADRPDDLEPIVATLWRHGGWPMIMEKGEWDDRIYKWQIVDDHFARLTGLNTFHDIIFHPLSWDSDEATLILNTPHLPDGIYKLLTEPYQGSDTSDENNESGEGSQENGSKEQIPKTGEDEENDEEDEGIEEDIEPEDEDEESQVRRVTRRRSQRRLGHAKRSSSKHSVGRKHQEGHLRRRPKRDIIQEIVFRKVRNLKRHNKHGVHQKSRKTGRKSPRNKHIPLAVQKKTGKNDMKRIGKTNNANVKSASKKKHAIQKKRTMNDEANEGVRRKNRNHHQGHERKSIHGNQQHRQRRLDRHRVHHAARKMEDKETDEAPNDNENEDSGNEIDTGSDTNNEDDGNSKDEEDDNAEENGNDEGDGDNDEGEEGGNTDDEGNEEEVEDDEEEDEKTIEELTELYRKYMISVAETFAKVRDIEIPRKKLEKDADDLIKFSIKLGESTIGDYNLENATLSEFQEWYDGLGSTTKNSKVNWKRKVLTLFTAAGLEPEGDLNVTITCSSYFEKLHALFEETPSEVIVNYIHWRFINTVALASSSVLQKLADDWEPMGASYSEYSCIQVEMSSAIGYEYTKKHSPAKLERMARDMIDDIQKEVEYQIKESTWLDDDTKHFILDKLVHLRHLVGAPDWYQNTTMVERYFQGLTIGTSYYENTMNYIRYAKWRELRYALMPEEYTFPLSMDPLMVNAFFMPTRNVIKISAADLQNPFFASNRPWNANFGIIGSIMAHEVNHGFDNRGHLYDRTGKPTEWLSAMASAYDKRAECFVRQFNNYDIIKGDSFEVENYGNKTAGENIADTMGLEASFRAYHRRLRACKKPDPALPGLEKYNNNQTFFLSFANLWCETLDPAKLKRRTNYDVHSPPRLRLIGSVSNVDAFAKSFNCPAGSPMNPEKKCNIWV